MWLKKRNSTLKIGSSSYCADELGLGSTDLLILPPNFIFDSVDRWKIVWDTDCHP